MLDEQICEQKDSIEVTKREAASEASSLRDVIRSLGIQLLSTHDDLQHAMRVGPIMRDIISEEMHEASARGSGGTLLQNFSQPASIPADIVDVFFET